MKDLQVPCIVCGDYITWDDSPMPAACGKHTYQEVFEAFDAAQQSEQADGVCPDCHEPLVNGVCPALYALQA